MITAHATKRIRKRIGIKKSAVKKMYEMAILKGVTHKQATGSLSRFFDALYLTYRTANGVKLYANFVWVFSNNTLITVFPLPHKFQRHVNKINNCNY